MSSFEKFVFAVGNEVSNAHQSEHVQELETYNMKTLEAKCIGGPSWEKQPINGSKQSACLFFPPFHLTLLRFARTVHGPAHTSRVHHACTLMSASVSLDFRESMYDNGRCVKYRTTRDDARKWDALRSNRTQKKGQLDAFFWASS